MKFYNENIHDLGHYFRTLYHIILYVKNSEIDDPKFYTNIVRAQLCNSELVLICLNCAFGYGREKFLILVEEFELFDNLDFTNIPEIESIAKSYFSAKAFGTNI